ncbi:MAG: 3-dehydroquinate synthase [Opitutales bacterium]
MKTLSVQLADRSYPIHFGRGLKGLLRDTFDSLEGDGRRLAMLADGVFDKDSFKYFDALDFKITRTPPRAVRFVHPGEKSKSLEELTENYAFLAENGIDRKGALFAFGGGVVGDLTGFTASTWLRGIDFYQIPTTLLAMVDSSVGGKTGINVPAGKNLVGAFWQPQAVFIDLDLLQTLPPREFAAGMAEVIKYGLLHDANLFEKLESLQTPLNATAPELEGTVRRCCEIKAEIVAADERETAGSGGRALLNLGHTFAHAIEKVAGYGEYLHGEAVAIGLVLAGRLSERLGCIQKNDTQRIVRLLADYDLPTALRPPLKTDALIAAMYQDKKTRAGKLRFVTLQSLGRAVTTDDVPEDWIREIWDRAMAPP